MKLIYMAAICPDEQYSYLMEGNIKRTSFAAHKFNRLLSDGFASCDGVSVVRIINNAIHQKLKANLTDNDYKSDKYAYLKLCCGILKHFNFLLENLKYIRNIQKKDENTVIVCDALNITSALVCVLAHLLYRIRTVAIITDLPQYVGIVRRRKLKTRLKDKVTLWAMNQFSAYVLLTEPMLDYVNKKKKPYCVVEGFCDVMMGDVFNDPSKKYDEKICAFVGSIGKADGILELIQAFDSPDMLGYKLYLCGKCHFLDELTATCNKTTNVQYRGIVTDSEVRETELRAWLLINPSLSEVVSSKYFFPSKIMEYMASGTPLLTTKLPGIPKEYYEYVYLIEDESVAGIRKALKEVLSKSPEELHEKGMAARDFVIREKNNILQAKKVLDMISSL